MYVDNKPWIGNFPPYAPFKPSPWPDIYDKKPDFPSDTPFTDGQWVEFREALKKLKEERSRVEEKIATPSPSVPYEKPLTPSGGCAKREAPSALGSQVGGSHYKDFKIQPFEFFMANQIPFHKADIIKRILRYDKPTGKGIEDLKKIKHEIELIIQIEGLK